MKKHIAKTISTLSLFVTLSVIAGNVYAFPVTSPWITVSGFHTQSSVSASNASTFGGCATCKPQAQYAESISAQSPVLDSDAQETALATQPKNSFSLEFFLTQLAMTFLYLP